MSSPMSELKIAYAPNGNDTIIKPKITDIKAEKGIPKPCKIFGKRDTIILMKFYFFFRES